MSKKILTYTSIIIGVLVLFIIYFSTVGIETEKFNKQIKDLIKQKNNKLDISLKKIKLTLDPLNFKINAKTIDAKIIYKSKLIELEYIKTQISLNSLIKNQFGVSQIEISTKSVLLKNFVTFIRSINNRPELFFLEKSIKKGYIIADLEFKFDELGELKNNYKINGLLKDGNISFFKKNEIKKINFLFNIKGNNFNFRDISFSTNNINFLSEKLNIKKNKKDYLLEGTIKNKNSPLSEELLQIIKLKYPQFDLLSIIFESVNDFSFNINKKLQVENLAINSDIIIDSSKFKKKDLIISKNFVKINDLIDIKDHKIKASYTNKKLKIEGKGQVKLQNKFELIDYEIINSGSDINLVSNIELSELDIKNQDLLKEYLPNTKDILNLKDHKIKLHYKDSNLIIKGLGKISLEKEFNKINYTLSKKNKKYNFEIDLEINDTPLKIDFINYKKNKNFNSQLKINGNYTKKFGLDFKKINFFSKNNRIIINDLIIDNKNKMVKIDKIDLDYIDKYNKKNKFTLNRTKNNNYEVNGSLFNADSLITNLLKSKDDKQLDIFKENINIKLNFSEVYIDNDSVVKNLSGKLQIIDNNISKATILAQFNDNADLRFTINTKGGEKITTLFSSKAKPLVKRYNFIKGYEGGYLDFYSSKKEKISKSTLKIYDFKLKEVPALTKLLTLASLQGVVDLLSGEGIRFNEFEMQSTNKNNFMTIDEIYAIGPSISIMMEGSIDIDKFISLRGTLVPATTLNKTIGSIPLLGKILVGSKTGEGVFGVSFKIKGPLKDLKTTVNPIRTLTPRFITRTLEKIKKN